MDHLLAPTSIGSKFRPIDQLERILGNHPNWKWIQESIRDVTEYHKTPIEEKTLITYLCHRILKGNHKSASGERATILATKIANEVEKGWWIPILPNHALETPNLEILPLWLSHQSRINENREIVEKDRVNHYLSFPGITLENSINEQMDRSFFAETHYGHMHKWLLHRIANMRGNYPTTRTLIRKDDFKSAYWRQHLSEKSEIQSATMINWKGTLYVLISLILTFGGANGPSKWSTIAKPIVDLVNSLLSYDTWEPLETQYPN